MCETGCCCGAKKNEKILEVSMEIINKFRNTKGALIPILHAIQDEFGYLPEEALEFVSEETSIPLSEIYGVATFYSFFSLEPKGEHVVRVCMGTACYVKGSQLILDEISKELNIEVGKTTEDGKFTLEACRCIGACGLAPVIMIGEKVYGRLVPEDIKGILQDYKN